MLYNLSTKQLILNSILISFVTSSIVIMFMLYSTYSDLPEVEVAAGPAEACVKVNNFANGDTFSCADVNISLRRYKKVVK